MGKINFKKLFALLIFFIIFINACALNKQENKIKKIEQNTDIDTKIETNAATNNGKSIKISDGETLNLYDDDLDAALAELDIIE